MLEQRTGIEMSRDCHCVVVTDGVDSLDFYDNLLIDFNPMKKKNLFFFSFLFMNKQCK